MKVKLIIGKIIVCLLIIGCSNSPKNYNIKYDEHDITIIIPMPTIGTAGIGQTTYDGFTLEDIEQDIFNELRDNKYKGNYDLNLTIKFKDKYGNYSKNETYPLNSINADDIKKYAAYNYFRGTVTKDIINKVRNRPSLIIKNPVNHINIGSNINNTRNEELKDKSLNDEYIMRQISESTFYRYHNTRFNYNISYPSFLIQGEESSNGDGCRFSINDDIYLVVSGINNIFDESIEAQYNKFDVKSVVYSRIKDSWFVISDYTPDGRIYYQKTALYNSAFVTASLYFPAKYKNEFNPIIKRIFTNFPY